VVEIPAQAGVWMEKFKIAMGFPMLATAFWLFSLLPIHYGERSWWLALFLVILGMAAWAFGEFVQKGHSAGAWELCSFSLCSSAVTCL